MDTSLTITQQLHRTRRTHSEAFKRSLIEACGELGASVEVARRAALLTDYAETLASLSEGRFAGKPTQLINQALKLNPEEPQALILAGVAAGEREDYKAAIGYWERLLPMVEPGSEEETSLKEALARLREKAEAQPGKKAARK